MTEQGDPPEGLEPGAQPPRPFASNSGPPPFGTPAPVVAWEMPAAATNGGAPTVGAYAGGPPPFTVGALLSDTFARYGANVLRFVAVAAVASGLSWLGSFATPTPFPTPSSNPFEAPAGSEASGLLGLLGFVVGIISSSTMFAIADSDSSVPFMQVLRRGVNRAGWVFLATLILGASLVGIGVVGVIVALLFGIISPPLAIVPILALFFAFIWVGIRLTVALPAVVSDGYDSIQALKLSWRVTRPTGVWARLLAASLLLGLLVAPGALGAILLVFPAMFGTDRQLVFLLLPAISGAILTPLTALIAYSAYRRLVVPHVPRWTTPATPAIPASPPPPQSVDPAPMPPPSSDAPVGAPAFSVPRFGTAAKGLLALVLAFDVAGIAVIPYGFSRMEALVRDGFPGFPGSGLPGQTGSVLPGSIEFGAGADPAACTLDVQSPFASRGAHVEWLGMLPEPLRPEDEVFVRVSLNEAELANTFQDHGAEQCLAGETPAGGLRSGIYQYEVIVNGEVAATGTLFVS